MVSAKSKVEKIFVKRVSEILLARKKFVKKAIVLTYARTKVLTYGLLIIQQQVFHVTM